MFIEPTLAVSHNVPLIRLFDGFNLKFFLFFLGVGGGGDLSEIWDSESKSWQY